jgi:hypothetical protein
MGDVCSGVVGRVSAIAKKLSLKSGGLFTTSGGGGGGGRSRVE